MASSSSSSISDWSYDVFLSFRGEDTRNNFVSHLYRALCVKGIFTFRDDKKLGKGKSIAPELRKAIQLSRFSIIILSENYASSSWCLDELLEILDCMDTKGQEVVPVFYNVNPSDVRKQKGTFERAFDRHQESFKNELNKVQNWREALKRVAELSGWDSRERDESLLIEEIMKFILPKLEFSYLPSDTGVVGMSSRIRNVISLLCMPEKTSETGNEFELDGVRIIGIWGMGGIGKTTIARATFDRIAKGFDACCFLTDVRDESKKYTINYLQKQLLSRTLKLQHRDMDTMDIGINFIKSRLCRLRVLLVLDDVDTIEQLESLAGGHDWFGKRSRILITSRRREILRGIADEIYEAKGLALDNSLELLCQHAFKQNFPDDAYMEMSEWIVNYSRGIPLALKALGSFLYKRSRTEWQSALEKLKRMPHDKIYNSLRISFDDLDSEEKDVFLDIACFFRGKDRNYVVQVLDSCGFSTEINLGVLFDRCLVFMYHGKLWMHDLIQQMGHEIVRSNPRNALGERSRLMCFDDIKSVLETNTGTNKIEVLALESWDTRLIHANFRAFLNMHGLRLLIFKNISFDGVSGGLETLPPSLKYMHWQGYPYQHLPFQYNLENLVILKIPHSGVKLLWEGCKNPKNLKVLDLRFCKELIGIPADLSAATNLEVLLLTGCTSLLEVHQSVGCLKKLRIMDMEGCTNLQNLPDSIHLESLERLVLFGCKKLRKFPKIAGKMNSLLEIELDYTAVEELPSSIDNLTGLKSLCLEGCTNLQNLPDSIHLESLELLALSGCKKLRKFPEIAEKMNSLLAIDLDDTAVEELPSSINNLTGLRSLNLNGCTNLHNLPDSIHLESLKSLYLSGCKKLRKFPEIAGKMNSLLWLSLAGTAVEELPSSINNLTGLKSLDLKGCTNLQNLPDSIHLETLQILFLSGCKKLRKFPEIAGKMNFLLWLSLAGTAVEELPSYIYNLTGLKYLNLEGCWMLKYLPNSICNLKYLERLILTNCSSLEGFPPDLHKLESLERFSADNCKALTPWSFKFPSDICLQHLTHLYLSNCNLVEVTSDICQLSSLRIVDLSRNDFESLSMGIGKLTSLKCLYLDHCKNLKSVELPSILVRLDANSCTSLETIIYLPVKSVRDSDHRFLLTNCSKLKLRTQAMELLFYINMENCFRICFPGTEVPKWFTHCATSSSITMELPSDTLFDYELGAFVLCVVVRFRVNCLTEFLELYFDYELPGDQWEDTDEWVEDNDEWVFKWEYRERGKITMDHLFFVNVPAGRLIQNDQKPPEKISTHFRFFVNGDESLAEVIKCGICLVGTKGEGDNIQAEVYRKTPEKLCPDAVTVLNHNGESLGELGVEVDFITLFGKKIKRPLEVYSNVEAGSSGSDYEKIQTNRIKEFKIF